MSIVRLDHEPSADETGNAGNGRTHQHANGYADRATVLQQARFVVEGDETMERIMDDIMLNRGEVGCHVVRGESGTGKECVARAIHFANMHAARNQGEFVPLNCAGISNDLAESELFGHEKGSFTGAATKHQGRFERARHGTLVLDEIGNMPMNLQPKLLRVLEDPIVERVGSNGEKIDVSSTVVVASTNVDLEQAIARGTFRRDLYYRLMNMCYTLPPLRERSKEHRLALASNILVKKNPPGFLDGRAEQYICSLPLLGNVRELGTILNAAYRRAKTTEQRGVVTIEPQHFPQQSQRLPDIGQEDLDGKLQYTVPGDPTARDATVTFTIPLHEIGPTDGIPSIGKFYADKLHSVLAETLLLVPGNTLQTVAEKLQISKGTLIKLPSRVIARPSASDKNQGE